MPFVKGQSGNPSGRKKVDPKVREMFSKLIPAAVKAIEAGLQDPEVEIRMKAAQIALDRALGKPAQAVELSEGENGPLAAILEIVRKGTK